MSSRTILLIDYDPGSIENAVGPLTEAGFRVEVANDGVSGLEAFERLQPDLVLIEPMVPKKHGFEVCQEIKESPQGQSVPVLITTGFYRGRKHRLEATQYYGCDEYLEKPVSAQDLVSVCSRLVPEQTQESKKPEQEVERKTTTPSVAGNVGELPDLTELSEEEIVARLDALITEDPQPLNQALAESTTKDESPRSSEESIADLPQELSEELIAELEEAPELVVEAAGEPAAGRSREAAIEEAGAATEAEPLEGSDRVAEVEEEQKLETSDDVEVVEEEKKLDESDGVELDDEEPEIQIVANQQEVEEPTSKSATGATAATSLSDAPQLQTSRVLAEAEKTATTEAAQAVTGVESIKAEQVEPSPHGGSRKWVWISVAAAAVVVIGVAVVLALVLGPGEAAPAESVAQLTPAAAKPVVQKPVKRLDPQAYLMGPPEPTRAEPPAAERDVARPTTTKVESGATRPLAATKANPSPRTAEVKPTPQPAVKPPADKRVSRSERTVEQKGQAGVAGTTATVAAATEQDAVETTKPPAQGDAPATPVVERSVAEIPEEGSSEGFVQSPAELAAEKPTETSDAPITDDLDPQQLQPSETRAAATPEAATPEPDPVRPTIRRGSLVDISEVDSGPTAVKKAPPKYPLAARSLRLEGTVTLRVLVDESGKVAAVEPVPGRSAEVLVNAAARAARGWTYRAATKDGVPVKVWLTERVSFKR